MTDTIQISSPHMHQQTSVGKVMRQVIYALVPGILVSAWIYGIGILVQCLLAIVFAIITEAFMLRLRNLPVKTCLYDGSAIVTALLFALAISPFTPVWVNLAGIVFAIAISKHAFGGLGHNLFNPAMAGYVFILLCFPSTMLAWPDVTLDSIPELTTLKLIFSGSVYSSAVDSISGATPLLFIKSQLNSMNMLSEISTSPIFGGIAGKGTEWINVAWIGGGVWLIYNRIIKWQTPLIFLGVLFACSSIFYLYDAEIHLSPVMTLMTGGTMLAAFFIITDPVTASATPRGKIIYFSGIAILTYLIRTWASYPDGIAFAVLLMNACVPFIDNHTRPLVFGESHGK